MALWHIDKIRLKTLGRALFAAAVLLMLLHIILTAASFYLDNALIFKISRLFDLDNERNIPTIYSGLLLGCAAFMSLLSLQFTKSFAEKWIWALLGGGFLYLAFDELLVIHESLAEPIRNILSISNGNAFYHAWVIPAIGITILIGLLAYWLKPRDKISRHQKGILKLTILLAGSVISLEIIGTQLYFSPLIYKLGPVLMEEMLEISIVSLILYRLASGFTENIQSKGSETRSKHLKLHQKIRAS